jgi:hypothetical protein
MPKSRKSHTPKARPKAPARGEWVSDELPPAVLEHARRIRVYTGRSYRKLSDAALRQIGEAFSMYRQTSTPPPQLDVAKAGELREVIADLFARIDGIDDGLGLALAVAWQRLRYDGKPYAPPDVSADANQFAQNRALLTRVLLPEIEFPPPAPAGSFDRWPAARQWLHVLDAGLREVVESTPAINKGGRPRLTGARDRLLAAVAQVLAEDGIADNRAAEKAADILGVAGIRAPSDPQRLENAAGLKKRKPRAERRGLRGD